MATPPFSLSTTTPGDSDIVSQFPFNERTLRDIIQSWILANHDTNGNHVIASFPWQTSTPTTPAASISTLFATATGRLKVVLPDGSTQFVGTPPGAMSYLAYTALPPGYLVADGSAVSRSTYADLFTVIGTAFGSGDGSTTFNLPDIGGRVIAGVDHAGTVLNSLVSGGAVFSAIGGEQQHTLITGELPSVTSSGTFSGNVSSTAGGFFIVTSGNIVAAAGNNLGGSSFALLATAGFAITSATAAVSGSVTSNNTFGTAHNNIQPTIVLTAVIKT